MTDKIPILFRKKGWNFYFNESVIILQQTDYTLID